MYDPKLKSPKKKPTKSQSPEKATPKKSAYAPENGNKQGIVELPSLSSPVQIKKPPFKANLGGTSTILSNDQMTNVLECVPDMYKLYEWKPVYASIEHGTSYMQLKRMTKNCAPFLMIIKDESGYLFGAFGNEPMKAVSNAANPYYGSGECFLFTFLNGQEVKDYKWTQKNDYFMSTGIDGIYFGGGGSYGLWINEDLLRGRSRKCETYENEQLSCSFEFDITKIEVWSINNPLFSRGF